MFTGQYGIFDSGSNAIPSANTLLVDTMVGTDSAGKIGGLPFASITAAVAAANAAITANQLPNPSGLTISSTAGTGGHLGTATYYYVVTAVNGFGETLASNEVNHVFASGTTNQVSLTWSAVAGATGYKVYRSTTTAAELQIPQAAGGFVTTNSFSDTGTITGTSAPGNPLPSVNTTYRCQIKLNPGTWIYDLNALSAQTASMIVLPACCSLVGAGQTNTFITAINCSSNGNNPCIINPGSYCTVSDLTVNATNNASVAAIVFPIGFNLQLLTDTAGDQVTLRNVTVNGYTDGILFQNNNGIYPTVNWELYDCKLNSAWDTINCFPVDDSSPHGAIVDAYNCEFTSTQDGALGTLLRPVTMVGGSNSIFRLHNCQIKAVYTGTAPGFHLVNSAGGGIIQLEGCNLIPPTTAFATSKNVINIVASTVPNNSTVIVDSATSFDPTGVNVAAGQTFKPIQPGQTFATGGGTLTGMANTTVASLTANGSTGTTTLAAGSDDRAGQITITPGGTGITTGNVVTLTFAVARGKTPFVTAIDEGSQLLPATTTLSVTSVSTTGFTITTATAALVTGTAYVLTYHSIP